MVMKDRWTMPAGLRRASALVAIVALAVGGAKVVDDNTAPGSGFSAVATVAADPTGPGGPTGGPGMEGGQQFQPPQMPSSMPDYQGGNNQPPLDQNSGISIYNTGSPGAQQVPGQQAGQQPQQAQQPAHGTQIPDYQTATPYTQGPGQANPDYQAPQQNSPQQPQQGQQQPQQQQQPSQQQEQQPQNKQDDTTRQLNDQQQQQRQQQCQVAVTDMADMADMASQLVNTGGGLIGSATEMIGGGGRSPIWFFEPGLDPIPADPNCPSCPKDSAQKDSGSQKNDNQQQPKDPRDCKNGAASGKCVPDKDVHEDCYVLAKGTSCGKVCESYNLGQFGQCVSRCATISCTEYLNQKNSRALAEWSTRFAGDHGGWKTLGCGALTAGAAYGSKVPGNPYVKLGAEALALFGLICGTSGGVSSIQAGIVLEAIKNQGGCIALTTYPFSIISFTRDVSGWCTNG